MSKPSPLMVEKYVVLVVWFDWIDRIDLSITVLEVHTLFSFSRFLFDSSQSSHGSSGTAIFQKFEKMVVALSCRAVKTTTVINAILFGPLLCRCMLLFTMNITVQKSEHTVWLLFEQSNWIESIDRTILLNTVLYSIIHTLQQEETHHITLHHINKPWEQY